MNKEKMLILTVTLVMMSFAVSMLFWLPVMARENDNKIGIAFYDMCERISNSLNGDFLVVSGACIIDVCDNSTANNSTIGFPFSVIIRNPCIEEATHGK